VIGDGSPWPTKRSSEHVGWLRTDSSREFEGERTIQAVVVTDEGGNGDVTTTLGAEGARSSPAGEITAPSLPNPSHIEAVTCSEGRAREEQDRDR